MNPSTLKVSQGLKTDVCPDEKDLKTFAMKIFDVYVKQHGEPSLDTVSALIEGGVSKLNAHHLDKVVEYLLYHGFVTKPHIFWNLHAIIQILIGLVKYHKHDKQMTTKIQKHIVTGIENVAKKIVEEGCKTEFWGQMPTILRDLCENENGFKLDMFKPLFLYADQQGAHDLMWWSIPKELFVGGDKAGLPDLLNEYCPNLARDKAKFDRLLGHAESMMKLRPPKKGQRTVRRNKGVEKEVKASDWKWIGNKHHKKKQYQKAIDAYTKAYSCGVECLLALHKPFEALEWLTKYDIDIGAEQDKVMAMAMEMADLKVMTAKANKEKKKVEGDGDSQPQKAQQWLKDLAATKGFVTREVMVKKDIGEEKGGKGEGDDKEYV